MESHDQCPKCGKPRKESDIDCPFCGIVYFKYEEIQKRKAESPDPGPPVVPEKQRRPPRAISTPVRLLVAGVVCLFVAAVLFAPESDPPPPAPPKPVAVKAEKPAPKTTSVQASGTKKTSVAAKSRAIQTYNEKDTARVGYTSYAVLRSWWSSKLSDNKFLDSKPDAMFLFIDLIVRNDDKKARKIPPFKLIDEKEFEYETTSKAWAIDGAISVLDSLNPGVKKQGTIVFDVPQNHRYNLKVSGGYWSGEDAYIKITPK